MNTAAFPVTSKLLILAADSTASESIVVSLRDHINAEFEYKVTLNISAYQTALEQCQADLVVCDLTLSAFTPTEALQIALRHQLNAKQIFIINAPTVQQAVDLMRLGARGVVDQHDTQRLIDLIRSELQADDSLPCCANSETEMRKLIADLETNRDYLHTVLETMQDAIISISFANRKVIYASASIEKIFGHPLSRFAEDAEFYKTLVHPDDLEIATNAMRTCMRNGFVELDHQIIMPDGQVRWLHRRAWITYDENGHPLSVIDTARDITSRIEALKEISSSEVRLRNLLETAPVGIILTDQSGIMRTVNQRAQAIFGYTFDDLVGHPIDMLVPDNKRSGHFEQRQASYPESDHHSARKFPELSARRKDGSTVPVSVDLGRLIDEDSFTVMCFITDLTEQRRAQDAKQESERRLRLFIENAPAAIAMFDKNMVYLVASRRWLTDYNLGDINIIGRSHYEVFPEITEHWKAIHRRCLAGAIESNDADPFVRADGSLDWVRWEIRPWHDDGGEIGGIMLFSEVITKRINAELGIRINEERYRSLVESSDAVISMIDDGGTMLYANAIAARQLKMPPEAIIGKNMRDLFPPQVADYQLASVQQVIRSEIGVVHEAKSIVVGEPRWYRTSIQPVRDAFGKVSAALINAVDITSFKGAEAALKEAHDLLEKRVIERTVELERARDRLEAIFSHSGDGILLVDIDLGIQHANLTFDEMFGIDSSRYLGTKLARWVHPDDADTITAAAQEVANRHHMSHIEAKVPRLDGSLLSVEISIAPVNRSNRRVTNLVCIIRDITERKHAEEALRETEERYRKTLMAMSEGIVLHERDGAITLCNAAAERILGLTTAQMMRLTSLDPHWRAIHEDGSPFLGDTHPAMVSLRTGEAQSNVVMGVHKSDGSLTWILINSQPLFGSEQDHPYAVVVTFTDITERKKAEEALEQALAQEKELGELKSRFVSMASHEFRTPLAAILATTETLAFYRDRMNSVAIDGRLERIRQHVSHMKNLMEDVLQLARIQAGKIDFKPLPGDVDVVCNDMVEEFQSQQEYHDRVIYTGIGAPILLEFDERLLRQIIGNLIHNALKYSIAPKVVQVTLTHDDIQFTLKVKDEGIGIPPEDLKRIFEPFHRAKNVDAISGTGLGLSITKQAVEVHSGTISVESEINSGTIFTVIIPKINREG